MAERLTQTSRFGMARVRADSGLRSFLLIWGGQLVTAAGTGLTTFTVGVWVYRSTNSVTLFTLIILFGTLPSIALMPLAGVLADTFDRRRLMIACHVAAGLVTLCLAALFFDGRVALWHVYLAVTLTSVFNTCANLVYTAATPTLVPPTQLGRASGMVQMGQATAQIIPPLLAGILVAYVQVYGVIVVDFATYVFAALTLLPARIPRPEAGERAPSEKRSLLREAAFGWTYIRRRAGLVALLVYFASVNFVVGMIQVLYAPMILGFSSAQALGVLLSIGGVGFLLGSTAMVLWGGPDDRVRGILGFGVLFGLCVMLTGLSPSLVLIGAATFGMFFTTPIINGCSQVIWQRKTPADVQGRVFSVRLMVSMSMAPLAYLVSGPLADKVFRPLTGDRGPGRGVGLMFISAGLVVVLAQLGGYLYPRLRRVERELPDALPALTVSEA